MLSILLTFGCAWFAEADRAAVLDHDADGFLSPAFGGDDCNDRNAEIGAASLTVHPDADADGLGAASGAEVHCAAGAGFVANNIDCDDTDAEIGAPPAAWPDGDADGYALDDAAAVHACDSTGFATLQGDCDDADDATHPGAVEDCLGAEDTNCDGEIGSDACTTAGLAPVVTGTEGGFGYDADFAYVLLGDVDVDGDGTMDVAVGMPYGYSLYAFSGVDLLAKADLELSDALMRFDEYHFRMGASLTAGDATGDGVVDLLVGCPEDDEGVGEQGAEVAVIKLPASGHVARSAGVIHSEALDGWFGSALAWTDDLDGVPALLVGAPVEATYQGRAYAIGMPILGGADHAVSDYPYASLGGLESEGDGYGLGREVAWLEGGNERVAVVADPQAVAMGNNSGTVMLWRPTLGDDLTPIIEGEGAAFYGRDGYEGFGYDIAVGDYDGDGEADLAVGSINARGQNYSTGAVFVFESAAAETSWVHEDEADVKFAGDDRNPVEREHQAELGVAVSFPGDMNGDGALDLAMGGPVADGLAGEADAGAVYVAPGGLTRGEYDVEAVTWARYGDRAGLLTGWELEPAGDLDGDGRADLLVGMPGWTDPSGTPTGAFTIWWGSQL